MRSERQVRRTRPKVMASCRAREWEPDAVGRGFLPREKVIERGNVTAGDNFQSPSPSAKCCDLSRLCMTAFVSRCVYYFIRWEHWNWRLEWLIIAGMWWWVGRGRKNRWREARGPGAQPCPGVKGAEPPDCHEMNLKCFINKFCYETRHDLWR